MGSNFARDLASGEFTISLEDAIAVHLTSNHYPPVPISLVPACIEAIDAMNASEPDTWIALPDGIGFHGYSSVEAFELVQALHLEAWLADEG